MSSLFNGTYYYYFHYLWLITNNGINKIESYRNFNQLLYTMGWPIAGRKKIELLAHQVMTILWFNDDEFPIPSILLFLINSVDPFT